MASIIPYSLGEDMANADVLAIAVCGGHMQGLPLNAELTSLGGELLYSGEIGTTKRFGVDYYQPVDAAQRFFVEAQGSIGRRRLNVYEDDHRIARTWSASAA